MTGQFFWPQLGKPKDDGNRQAIRQKHLVKNYFCRWSHIRDVLIHFFWQLKQVLIDIVPNTVLTYFDSPFATAKVCEFSGLKAQIGLENVLKEMEQIILFA